VEHIAPGTRVLVVGGSSGIGAATAAHFRAAGADVLVADVNPPSDHGLSYARCDLRDPAIIDQLLAQAGTGWDVLAHVAGLPGTRAAVDVLNVNFLGMRHLVRGMLDRLNPGGSVVVVASTAGMLWQHPAVKRLAPQAWSERGVRINVVSPGPVGTAILPDFEATMGKEFLDSVSAAVGRHAQVEDIVPVIAFLSSPAAGWLIGQDIHVDAGFTSALVSAAH
jgi:NAD(P)-dependent dehydrogenase (short-subunit alcohol dehydrogenase family)